MLISKEQLKFNVCGDDENKTFICLDDKGAVSTDGKRIMIVPYPEDGNLDLFETEVTRADAKYSLGLGERILVSAEQAKQISNAFCKGDGAIPGVQFAAIEKNPDGTKSISMVNPDEGIQKEFLLAEKFDDFPNYKMVIPSDDKLSFEIIFITSLLVDLLTKMQKAGKDFTDCLRVKFHGQHGVVEFIHGDIEENIKGYIMPCRGKDEE